MLPPYVSIFVMTSSQSSRMDWHLAYEKSEKSPQIWHLAYVSLARNCHDVAVVALESCGETFFKLLLIPKYMGVVGCTGFASLRKHLRVAELHPKFSI